MSNTRITIQQFFGAHNKAPVFDVRSPKEFISGHIPGAYSLPIFSDEERAEIGTAYKQIDRQTAIKIGLKYFGSQLNQYVETVEGITKKHQTNAIYLHCWRGGMRSSAMAWLLGFYGFEVYLLEGGYKAYRNHVLQQLGLPFQLNVLGGFTGSGKTQILNHIKTLGIPVIDLEHLAQHKGSAFGNLNNHEQPTQEQFENNLVQALSDYYHVDEQGNFFQPQPIWIENESQRIGLIDITKSFFHTMQNSPLIALNIPFEERLRFIVQEYSNYQHNKLKEATIRIQKKLGGLQTKEALGFIEEGKITEAFAIFLSYYDKLYTESMGRSQRKAINISSFNTNLQENTNLLLQLFHS
jgi:tRNA 2-selenouridine synthase